jgi:TonB family protein
METLEPRDSAFVSTEPELDLLLARDYTDDRRRWRTAAIVSLVWHIVLISTVASIPESAMRSRVYEQPHIVRVTPLYIPTELTQKAPNKDKISKELTVEAIAPRPVVKAPSPAPAAKRTPAPAPLPPPQVTKVEPKPQPAPEPPKVQVEAPPAPQPEELAKVTPPTPPPPNDHPKLVMENVAPPPPPKNAAPGKPPGGLAVPNPSVEAAVRNLSNGGAAGGRQIVGENGADEGGMGLGLNLPPSAGRPRSNLELRSDPMGVDFRPYMLQVLAAVRRNWFAVYPEAARLGQRGEVILEFAITKPGVVNKVIYATESGAKALDQSAVAAISASNPLPPLPAEFKGDRIVLRMTFMYNMQR